MRKRAKAFIILVLATLLLLSFASCKRANSSKTLYVDKVENMPDDFIMGMDASCVPSLEASGVKYYDHNGKEKDVYQILSENGVNYIRVRIWNDPFDKDGNGYGGGNCDINNAVEIGKRATKYGMKLLVNFHYSDFWADPAKQMAPKDWKSLSIDNKCEALYDYTKDCLQQLVDAGVDIGMVQIGNETRNGMLWPSGQLWTDKGDIADGWSNYAALSNAGYDAAKSVFEDIIVIVHLNNAWEDNDWWFSKFQGAGGKFDMIGLSHYPQSENGQTWQTINQKALSNIRTLSAKYGKDVMVCEIGVKVKADEDLAAQVLDEFMKEAMQIEDCAGIFYWEPQVNGTWKPKYYNKLGWHAYDLGAFTSDNKPSKVLNKFR